MPETSKYNIIFNWTSRIVIGSMVIGWNKDDFTVVLAVTCSYHLSRVVTSC